MTRDATRHAPAAGTFRQRREAKHGEAKQESGSRICSSERPKASLPWYALFKLPALSCVAALLQVEGAKGAAGAQGGWFESSRDIPGKWADGSAFVMPAVMGLLAGLVFALRVTAS